ncbi:MAG: hypothetical protein MnENMB40S_33140 [Rhizobiaceae bacterium MnEN-MB40S]|nr:MAG: hypothetical protein MnENMB40S_33140 [Rhizobiaceae bacterium MnEN-MB40S]
MRRLVSSISALVLASAFAGPVSAGPVEAREGWVIMDTSYSFADLNSRLDAAIKDAKMGLVTQASASRGAESRGVTIPGNRVVGVYRNDFAVRMLEASLAAGIETPIRFYVTEGEGGSTLSYKTPTFVFTPYFDEGGEALKTLATELDSIFVGIADQATGE